MPPGKEDWGEIWVLGKQEERAGGGKGIAINQRAANKAEGEKPQPAAKRY